GRGGPAHARARTPAPGERTWGRGTRPSPPRERRTATRGTAPFGSRLLPLLLPGFHRGGLLDRLDARPVDLDADVGGDLDRHHLVGEVHDAPVHPAAHDHLVVALEIAHQLVLLAAPLLLRPDEQEVEDPDEDEDETDVVDGG